MFGSLEPSRLRLIGAALCLAGAGLYLAVWLLFDGHWIALTMFGLLGWLNAAAYAAVGLGVVGGVLMIASIVARRS